MTQFRIQTRVVLQNKFIILRLFNNNRYDVCTPQNVMNACLHRNE